MKLDGAKVLLTGADGGIGRFIAAALAAKGAELVVTGRIEQKVTSLVRTLPGREDRQVHAIAADLSDGEECERLILESKAALGQIDLLINLAGLMNFNAFSTERLERLELIFRVNSLAPMILSRLVLPEMIRRNRGQIVNVGSALGSIGFPYHVSYSSTKFALRGFSEALRRELHGSGVSVTYVAPRATATGFTDVRMALASGMTLDRPERVAMRIVEATENDMSECFLGFPESLFARINALVPTLIDRGLKKQARAIKAFVCDQSL